MVIKNRESLASMGKRIAEYRKLHHLTQKEVSEKLDIGELYYGQIERGERRLSLAKLIDVCEFYNITLNDIIPLTGHVSDEEQRKIYYEEICDILDSCSAKQLAVISGTLQYLAPFIKE